MGKEVTHAMKTKNASEISLLSWKLFAKILRKLWQRPKTSENLIFACKYMNNTK